MEEKKRPMGRSLEEPVAKRPVIDINYDELTGPLTQEDVVKFQKEAIFRQMQIYKREKDLLQERADGLQKDYDQVKSCFHVLSKWFDRVVDVFGGPDALNGKQRVNGTIPQSLLLTAVVEGESEFATVLSQKENVIKSRLSSVMSTDPQITQLQDSLSVISSKFHYSQSQCDDLRLVNEKLKSELAMVTERYLQTAKRLERLESPTLNRIISTKRLESISESAGSVDPGQPPASKDVKGEAVSSSPAGNAAAVTELTKELESTKYALTDAQAVVAKQKDQLEEQSKALSALNDQVREFNYRLLNLSETDLANSDAFKLLKQRNSDLVFELKHLSSQKEKLQAEKSELIVSREEFEARLKEEYTHKKESVDEQLNRAEQDVARIRGARDDLLSELNIKKAVESEKAHSINHLKELVGIRDARIQELESQITRYREENSDNSCSGANVDGAGIEDLKALVAKLQRQNKSLSAEISGLEQAFAKANAKATSKVFDAVERDAKVNKLTIEKTKADEKYFGAMRAKDQLGFETNRLKGQLAKSAEVIQQLRETENSKSLKISRLEKEIQSQERKIDSHKAELQLLKSRIGEQTRRLDSATRVIERLNQDLRNKDTQIRAEVDIRLALEIENEKLSTQVKTSRIRQGTQSEIEEQLESLRSIAICSVCSKNWKDTALKVCGHVFCNDCAKDRLNARLRKCPVCNRQYSFNDLLSVHL